VGVTASGRIGVTLDGESGLNRVIVGPIRKMTPVGLVESGTYVPFSPISPMR